MRAFIDGFNLIRIESDVYIYHIEIEDNQLNWLKNEGFNQFFTSSKPIQLHVNDWIIINDKKIPLEIGIVTLSKEFELRFRYDGPLGYVYTKDQTTFTLFSPVAKEVILVVDDLSYPMHYQEPIWQVSVSGDLNQKPYHYRIRLVDTFRKVNDPYTVACSTTSSYVIDWDQMESIHPTSIKLKHYVDAVLYEGHVRDLTINLDVEHKGTFDGLLEKSKLLKGNVIDYVKKLGITHLQLLPVYDFEGVDDLEKEKRYNWGYNPSQYFAIEGWFSKNPDDPTDRINMFRKVINYAHQKKLGINMDVVYNHVYNHLTFPYDYIVPGYFYRHNSKNTMTESSYCGNDVETRNYMVRRLIVDSLSHLATNYQIDGFRFDLMGLLDIDTMLMIEKTLKAINPSIMLYGEGWNMSTEVPQKLRSNMGNQALFKSYAHFNDSFRNIHKGELHGPGIGYTMGNKHLIPKAMDTIIGSKHLFSSPNQSINYVECHDNLTYYDKMLLSCGFENPDFKYCQDFANHLIAISQGVPFYHAGQEFYRTKLGVENSYNSPDEINKITLAPKIEAVSKLKKLLKL
ncbi:MAG: alpha-amylase family glycosyl hydrolase [Acholeplasmataceae bacterium]|jgi:pullulanase|nr:alpha-amylase family glycosyl hydrolase [Acholeplasmataceae bacterium]